MDLFSPTSSENAGKPLRQNTALFVGTASANLVKKTTLPSGSSARAVPQESPYSAYAKGTDQSFESGSP